MRSSSARSAAVSGLVPPELLDRDMIQMLPEERPRLGQELGVVRARRESRQLHVDLTSHKVFEIGAIGLRRRLSMN
jgi:hypothetical protein